MEKKITQVQKFLKERHIDGWLLYDFHGNNELARHFLDIADQITTRRFFYWIPVQGKPIKIVHLIEAHVLDQCPGSSKTFLSWQSLEKELGLILRGCKTIVMEFSPKNIIPYVSRVDAGTIDLIRSFGIEVMSSADFLLYFTAVLTEVQATSHLRAAKTLDRIAVDIWEWIGYHWQKGITEYDIQQRLLAMIKKKNLVTNPPTVGINAHSADPHHKPIKERSLPIKKGDFILIDFWGKEENGVFADICRVGVIASQPTEKQSEIFHIVHQAQNSTFEFIKSRFNQKKRVEGWEADDIARNVIREAGYENYFIHRTGHNIETHLHGSGAHLDNLEIHDTRPLLPMTCFSIEPGIYLPGEFGIRLEHNVLIHKNGNVEITGGKQDEIVCLL